MAWAQCGLSASSSLPPSSSSSSRTSVIARRVSALVPSPSPSKSSKRKNHLRSKILKSLTKPNLHQEHLESSRNLSEVLEIVREEEIRLLGSDGDVSECFEGFDVAGEADYGREEMGSVDVHASVSDAKRFPEIDAAFATRSVVEIALYFLGLFVVQTVCTFVVMGSAGAFMKSGNGEEEAELGVSEAGMLSGRKKEGFFLGEDDFGKILGSKRGVAVDVDASRMKEKVAEIRAMARKAREIEMRKLGAHSAVSSSDVIEAGGGEIVQKSGNSGIKTNIEKEVDQRLSKIEKKLRSLEEKSLTSVNYLVRVKDSKVLESSDANLKDGKVVSKKKVKFKHPRAKPRNNPKGFGSVRDHSVINGKCKSSSKASCSSGGSDASDALHLSTQEQQIDYQSRDNSLMRMTTKEEESNCLTDDAHKKPLTRLLKKGEANGHFSVDKLRSQGPGRKADEEGQSLKRGVGMTSENMKSTSSGIEETCLESAVPRKLIELETKSSQKVLKEDESEPMLNNVRDERMDIQNDSWWMNLPYAMAILLRNVSDHEEPRGLYSLKMNEVTSSYTVAFEDQRDATNFCYILETFFEELDDFRADVVPLSIRELIDAIKSMGMKIIVVRKGQLKLYAGQPLADVETTLRHLCAEDK